jgi:hypothetical protein
MIKLAFPSTMLSELAAKFREEPRESFALILARPAQTASNGWRLLVHSVQTPLANEYEARSEREVRPGAAFRLIWEKRARQSHGSRFFLNQLVYQYFIPCIDMGVVITAQEEKVFHFGGRVQMMAPGLGCLVCNDGIPLSPDQVRWDLSNERQRSADPYFARAAGIKQPSVISLNSQAASHAVTMFLAAVAGFPMEIRSQAIRGMQGVVRALQDVPRENCVNCSRQGFFGKGRLYNLPARAI